jgi:peptidyl-prolyl cis-trans isomerase B (cyclophilin B)
MSNRDPIVTFTLDSNASSGIGGTFVMELFPDKAPNSVNYFINLIIEGYYNKFNVSQVHENAMVVFGDPWYQGGNNRVIRGEFAENGFMQNDVDFVRGTVGLALDEGDPDSNYGDFFIVLDDAAKDSMNGKFCAIGRVIEGLEILDEISLLQTSSSLKYQPYASVRTLTVTVDLKGRVYPTAETLDRKNKPGYWDE